MNEVIEKMRATMASLEENLVKVEGGNKAAAARARKETLKLSEYGKIFRKKSIEAMK